MMNSILLSELRRLPAKLHGRYADMRHAHGARKDRGAFFSRLLKFAPRGEGNFKGTVFIDGTFSNPLFWFRYGALRKAMGLGNANEMVMLGDYTHYSQHLAAKSIGIRKSINLVRPKRMKDVRRETHKIMQQMRDGVHLFDIKLPFDIPSVFLYDYLLATQTNAEIDIDHPRMQGELFRFLKYTFAANDAFDEHKPDLVVASHPDTVCINFVWQAKRRGIKVLVLNSDFNTLRFWNINENSHIFDFMDRPRPQEALALPQAQKDKLEKVGRQYLSQRLSGQTDDLGATYAYVYRKEETSRTAICQHFNWAPDKPIIGVYASNWFDYPHLYGMQNFENFKDWILELVKAARENPHVNWMFKSHPCDDWYGGITLEDIINLDGADNISIVPKSWSSTALIDAVDGIITYHGTIGVEATMLGTPVLVADRGWYDDWEFVKRSPTREAFLNALSTSWWTDMDTEKNARTAAMFACFFWGRPDWQKGLTLPDDTQGISSYPKLCAIFDHKRELLDQEIACLTSWSQTDAPHYHAYKMLNAHNYLAWENEDVSH